MIATGASLLDEGIKILRDRRTDKLSKETLVFWLKEEVRYNLELMNVWRDKDGNFEVDEKKALKICGYLRIDVSSIILSDINQSALLREALASKKWSKLSTQLNRDVKEESKINQDVVELLLALLRRVHIIQILAVESQEPESGLAKQVRFAVRLKNIYTSYKQLLENLKNK
jgi:hypothetical protein